MKQTGFSISHSSTELIPLLVMRYQTSINKSQVSLLGKIYNNNEINTKSYFNKEFVMRSASILI